MSGRRLVALVVSAAVLISCGGVSRSMPTPSPPSNMTIASYRGVGVFVPSTWPHDRLQCGTPVENTVILGHEIVTSCRLLSPPLVNYVWIRAVDVQHDPIGQVATETTRWPISQLADKGRHVVISHYRNLRNLRNQARSSPASSSGSSRAAKWPPAGRRVNRCRLNACSITARGGRMISLGNIAYA